MTELVNDKRLVLPTIKSLSEARSVVAQEVSEISVVSNRKYIDGITTGLEVVDETPVVKISAGGLIEVSINGESELHAT